MKSSWPARTARNSSASVLTALENEIARVLLVGDFNAAAGQQQAYSILTDENFFTDAVVKIRCAPGRRHRDF